MIDGHYWNAYKINVILIIMLKSKVLCHVVGELPVSTMEITSEHTFTEYFNEHNVSYKDAANAFRSQADELLKSNPSPMCSRTPCNSTTRTYCLNKMLHDHCCCDFRHGKETFPWLPHSCYVGKTCKAIIGSCIAYTEIRDCCCNKAIAEKWKDTFSTSTRSTVHVSLSLALVLIVLITL